MSKIISALMSVLLLLQTAFPAMLGAKTPADVPEAPDMTSVADYMNYVQEYGARGIEIRAVSPQNEALCETMGEYPCCTYSARQEGEFVRDHLAPALRRAGSWIHRTATGTV